MRHLLALFLCGILIAVLAPSAPGGTSVGAASTTVADTVVDPSDGAWSLIRARTPAARAVYRPGWLPARFDRAAYPATFADGLLFGVLYQSAEGDRLLFGTTGNSCSVTGTTEPITVRGVPGMVITHSECAPEIEVAWREGDEWYNIKGFAFNRGVAPSRDEMLQIAASLSPVGADGRPLTPAGPPTQECFAATSHCLAGRFLERWRATGGLAINGYPLSAEFRATLEDGKVYTVQYFERVRLEHHPENAAPYDVLLGQFGRRIRPADPPVPPRQDAPQYFPETGHNLSGRFVGYWRNFGGLAQFGYPLSEEIQETIDGKTYLVQYFERARLEYHPENPFPYDILLGQFGRRILTEEGGAGR